MMYYTHIRITCMISILILYNTVYVLLIHIIHDLSVSLFQVRPPGPSFKFDPRVFYTYLYGQARRLRPEKLLYLLMQLSRAPQRILIL